MLSTFSASGLVGVSRRSTFQTWMGDFIEEQAIPQGNYRSNPSNQGGLAPKLVDPTTRGRSYELPGIWAEWLEEVAVRGSGKVKKGRTP